MKECNREDYKPLNLLNEMFGLAMTKSFNMDDIDLGATDNEAKVKKGAIA